MMIEAVNNFGDTREGASAGPMALAVIALLAIATILLWRNMTNRIKRLPASFPDPTSPDPTGPDPTGPAETSTTATTDADPGTSTR